MDYILKTKALTKTYGRHKALDNFSMCIPPGAIYGLVGKNGAGKTTLLRLICGLQEATSGDYTLFGISSRKHEILNARSGMGAVIETPANPLYIDGTPRAVLEVVNDLLPSGQAMQLADAFDSEGIVNKNIENTPYRWLGYSFLMIVLTSGMGIALFRKKEIR